MWLLHKKAKASQRYKKAKARSSRCFIPLQHRCRFLLLSLYLISTVAIATPLPTQQIILHAGTFQAPDPLSPIVIEAEHYQESHPGEDGKQWVLRPNEEGSPIDAMWVAETAGYEQRLTPADAHNGPHFNYRVQFPSAGTYAVWVRMNSGGSAQDDSVHLSLNGAEPSTAARITTHGKDGYHWTGQRMNGDPALLAVDTAAEHTLTLWMREDGTRIDRLLLTQDTDYRPPTARPYPCRESTAGALCLYH